MFNPASKLSTSALVLLLLLQPLYSQTLNLHSCRFRGWADKVYVELYVELPRYVVTFFQDGDQWSGVLHCTALITNRGDTLASDEWRLSDYTADPQGINSGQKIVDARSYNFAGGDYQFHVTISDSVSGNVWSGTEKIEITAFPDDGLSLSDIELATHLIPAELNPNFDRGGFGLVPALEPVITAAAPYFIYYVEIYPPSSHRSSYTINRTVLDGAGDTVKTLPQYTMAEPSGSFADMDSVRLDSLMTGSYLFVLQVSTERGESSSRKARFFTYRPDLGAPHFGAKPPTAAAMITDQDSIAVESEWREINFLLSAYNINRTGRMTLREKMAFLDHFWYSYDDDTTTAEVPVRRLFHRRIAEADERFGNSRSAGHKTNRGRIYVLYGEPDTREVHPLDREAKPYEIWSYQAIEGGVEFVFVDRSGFGTDYTLVHSTKRGEIYNPDWYAQYVHKSSVEGGR